MKPGFDQITTNFLSLQSRDDSPVEKRTTKTLELFPSSRNQHSPQSFPQAKSIFLDRVLLKKQNRNPQWKHSKQGLKMCILFIPNNSLGFNFPKLPSICQGFIFQDKDAFQQYFTSYYIYDKCIWHNLIYFENVITTCIHLHATNPLPCRKSQSTKQKSSFG